MLNYIRILNLVLLAALVFVGFRLYHEYTSTGTELPELAGVVKRDNAKGGAKATVPLKGLLARDPEHSFAFYQSIIDKNLFRSDRTSPQDGEDGAKGDDQMAINPGSLKFTLYGVAVMGDERVALLGFTDVDPKTRRRSEKIRMVAVGDNVNNVKITAIDETSITMGSEEEPFTLNVYDPKEKKTRRQDRTPVAMQQKVEASSRRSPVARPPQQKQAQSPVQMPAKTPNSPMSPVSTRK
jgi:hypothetical protein